jgi:hypothetical protein
MPDPANSVSSVPGPYMGANRACSDGLKKMQRAIREMSSGPETVLDEEVKLYSAST